MFFNLIGYMSAVGYLNINNTHYSILNLPIINSFRTSNWDENIYTVICAKVTTICTQEAFKIYFQNVKVNQWTRLNAVNKKITY